MPKGQTITINEVEEKVDEIEKLIKEVDNNLDDGEKITLLEQKITELKKQIDQEKVKPASTEPLDNDTLKENKVKLQRLDSDMEKLEKKLKSITRKASIGDKEHFKQISTDLGEVGKALDKVIKSNAGALNKLGDDNDNDVQSPTPLLRKMSSAANLPQAGTMFGDYIHKVCNNIEHMGALRAMLSRLRAKFGNTGSTGFKRLTRLFVSNKRDVPRYVAEMVLARARATDTEEERKGALGLKAAFDLACNHVLLLYRKSIYDGLISASIKAGGKEITAKNLTITLKPFTLKLSDKNASTFHKVFVDWEKKLKENIKKDLSNGEDLPSDPSTISHVKETLIGIKKDADGQFRAAVSIKAKPSLKT